MFVTNNKRYFSRQGVWLGFVPFTLISSMLLLAMLCSSAVDKDHEGSYDYELSNAASGIIKLQKSGQNYTAQMMS